MTQGDQLGPCLNAIMSMSSEEIIGRLADKGVRATANRVLVYEVVSGLDAPASLSALETLLPTMDRSSIYRVLTLFLQHDVLHAVDDGTRQAKYEACPSPHLCHAEQGHVHFHCERCGRTFCLSHVQVPAVALPKGYSQHAISYIVKGACPACQRKAHMGKQDT